MNVMLQGETDEEEQSHMLSPIHHDVYLDILSSLLVWRNIQGKELKKNSTDLLRGEKRANTLVLANMTFHDICSVLVTNGGFTGRSTGLRERNSYEW